MLSTALALVALFAGPFAKPTLVGPQVSKSDAKIEAQRQFDYTLESRLADLRRLDTVAERLLVANADLCPESAARFGFRTATLSAFKGPYREALVRRWGETDAVVVSAVTPGSAAAAAGLQAGDQVVALEGQPVAGGKSGHEKWLKASQALYEKNMPTLRLGVWRNGETRELTLQGVKGCAYNVVLDDESSDLNAYADGKRLIVTRPMLRLAASDNELALVLAHELAHNARRHIAAKTRNARVGMLGGLALDLAAAAAGGNTQGEFMKLGANIGAGMYSPEFESEADYVGMYFMARAGFTTDSAETFWRKMAAEEPRAILTKSSHPPTTQRYLTIAATREEIARKVAASAPLTPGAP